MVGPLGFGEGNRDHLIRLEEGLALGGLHCGIDISLIYVCGFP